MRETCDGIILGAGHNALVLHADLGLEAQWAPKPAASVLARLG